jgi:hypothetical protein
MEVLTSHQIAAFVTAGLRFLRRHNALILPKNVLYIEKPDEHDRTVATGALPLSGSL